jgi:hypothetical protein
MGGASFAGNAPVCNLDRRLHFRAVSNALTSLVRSLTRNKAANKADENKYAELLPFIFAKWSSNRSFNVLVSLALTIMGTEVICLVITVVSDTIAAVIMFPRHHLTVFHSRRQWGPVSRQ